MREQRAKGQVKKQQQQQKNKQTNKKTETNMCFLNMMKKKSFKMKFVSTDFC